jgi:hypothetical protein
VSKKRTTPNPLPFHAAHLAEGVERVMDCSECPPRHGVPLTEWRPIWRPREYCSVCGVEKNLAGYHVWPE